MASNIRVTLEVDNKKYLSDIKASESATKKFADEGSKLGSTLTPSLGKVGSAAEQLRGKLDNLKGVFAAVISAGALQQANAYANEVKDISDTADVSIASIIGLSKAFEVNGGSAEGARNAILKFGQTIGDAVGGSAEAQKTLQSVGISLKDIQTLGQQDLLSKAVKGIADLESTAMRAKAQMAIFGKQAKSVNFPGVQDTFGSSTTESAKYKEAIKAGSDASEALNKNLGNLKQALLEVSKPLNELVASVNITVQGFKTFLTIITAIAVAWLAFGKATSVVYSIFDTLGKGLLKAGGLFSWVAGELKAFGSIILSVFTNLGKAVGIIAGGAGGLASFSFAMSGILRLGLRFAGWIGIFTAVGEAINWAIKQLTGFDALDAIGTKLGIIWDKAKSVMGFGNAADQKKGSQADVRKIDNAIDAEAWQAQQKAIDEAKAKAKEFAERQAIITHEIKKTSDAFKIANQESRKLIEDQIELVGKSQEEVEMASALEEVYKRIRTTTQGLIEKRKEWALSGTPEQKANLGLITEEIKRIEEAGAKEVEKTRKTMTALQSAQLLEEDRKRTIENITKALEAQLKVQEALSNVKLSIIGAGQDTAFQKSQIGKGDLQKQMADIAETNRKAGLEASRAFAQAFEDGGDGLTAEQAQQLADGLNAIAEGYKTITDAQLANLDLSRSWAAGWDEAFANYRDAAQNSADQARTYFSTFTTGVEDAIVNFVKTGKLSFKDLANSLIAEFTKSQVKNIFSSLLGMGGSGGSNIFGSIASFFGFGGGKASGGSVMGGKSYMVGEQGPEMFTPRGAGVITPNQAFGGSSNTVVTYNIQAVDAASFKSLVASDPEFIFGVSERGRRNLPLRSRL
jgi:lambda family phage tail tape measure protein